MAVLGIQWLCAKNESLFLKDLQFGECVVGLEGLRTSCLNDTAGAGGQMKTLIASSHLFCMAQRKGLREHYCEQCQDVTHSESLVCEDWLNLRANSTKNMTMICFICSGDTMPCLPTPQLTAEQ